MEISGKILWAVALAAQVGTFAAPGPEYKSSEATQLRVTVYVYNYAEVSAAVLAQAKREVTRRYRQAGVQTEWVDCPFSAGDLDQRPACPPSMQLGPAEFTVRILPRSLAPPEHANLFGFGTLPKDGKFGFHTGVYADGPDMLGKGRDEFQRRILGLLIAHEIGHLLLATESHAHSGIMHFPWSAEELAASAQGRLSFDLAQAQRMRAQVSERVRHTDERAQVRESRLRSAFF
jgi:hypothetical protein